MNNNRLDKAVRLFLNHYITTASQNKFMKTIVTYSYHLTPTQSRALVLFVKSRNESLQKTEEIVDYIKAQGKKSLKYKQIRRNPAIWGIVLLLTVFSFLPGTLRYLFLILALLSYTALYFLCKDYWKSNAFLKKTNASDVPSLVNALETLYGKQ